MKQLYLCILLIFVPNQLETWHAVALNYIFQKVTPDERFSGNASTLNTVPVTELASNGLF